MRRRLRGESAGAAGACTTRAKSREHAAAAPAAGGERADRVNVVLGVLRDRLSADGELIDVDARTPMARQFRLAFCGASR